jgi:hypothetical protein
MPRQPGSIFISIYIMVLGILLVVSLSMFFLGIRGLATDPTQSTVYMVVGTSGIAITLYSLRQIQSRSKSLKVQVAKVVTVLECNSCHNKVTRNFKEGDYVYGTAEVCTNCNASTPLMITSIFSEKPTTQKLSTQPAR